MNFIGIQRILLAIFFFSLCINAKHFVVLVPSYNNAANTIAVLDSIFLQDHPDFEVMFIDDASRDGTGEIAQSYQEQHQLYDQLTIIINKTRQRKMRNIYIAIHECPDEAIIFQHDGDDTLAHNHVLSDLDQLYEQNDLWLTYGNVKNIPKSARGGWIKKLGYGKTIPSKVIEQQTFREYPFFYSQPRSHYAWLFKRIKLEDLITYNITGFEGAFYPASNDNAFMFPMLEMAYKHFMFVGDIGYLKNIGSPLVGWKVDNDLQEESSQEIRQRERYARIKKPIMHTKDFQMMKVALLFLSKEPNKLKGSLPLLEKNNLGTNTTIILFSASNEEKRKAYLTLSKRFPQYAFIDITHEDAKELLLLHTKESDYLILSDDTAIQDMNSTLALPECLEWLEKTYAYTFILTDPHPTKTFFLNNDINGLQFRANKEINPHRFCSLYRKQDLMDSFFLGQSSSIESLIKYWQDIPVHEKKIALYKKAKDHPVALS